MKLDPKMFTETDFAGVFIADIIRHYARAFVQAGRVSSEDEALHQIKAALDSEWQEPTDQIEGNILN